MAGVERIKNEIRLEIEDKKGKRKEPIKGDLRWKEGEWFKKYDRKL